jgi:hypothetical protein
LDLGLPGNQNRSATNKKSKPQFIIEELNEEIDEITPSQLNLHI